MLSRLVITFLPRNKRLLILWLRSPSAVILEPKKMKSNTVSTVSPSISPLQNLRVSMAPYCPLVASFPTHPEQRSQPQGARDHFCLGQCSVLVWWWLWELCTVGLDAKTRHLEPTSLSSIYVEALSALAWLTLLSLICALLLTVMVSGPHRLFLSGSWHSCPMLWFWILPPTWTHLSYTHLSYVTILPEQMSVV